MPSPPTPIASALSPTPSSHTSPSTFCDPVDLHHLKRSAAIRCAVPTQLGGLGGDVADLSALMEALCRQSLSAALLFWSQRLAIEFLVQTGNVAVREHLLPDLLTFQRAASLPLSLNQRTIQARDTGRGWQLSAQGLLAAHATPAGFSFVAPIEAGDLCGWGLLRSEEDGFDVHPQSLGAGTAPADTARIDLRQVFFREDEWLGGPELDQTVHPVRRALGRLGLHLAQHMAPI
ncbi:acyl-CoA dehydrogenase family protein [Curvibacter sp. HBC28]|uniref:Acyl-CoA dehydrogenase family protein n=1 Tax=Curvibacter microcysteis TaxID=3026419 RepID=A0ABT5MLD1_9BURK|nr:acyl-CoA dehydrogenase family protein [Curvibacter sp. HBC28]MDD0815971.1 acyl-CoA dehydrogenase family protein [Curvibacter sp. HBC28]